MEQYISFQKDQFWLKLRYFTVLKMYLTFLELTFFYCGSFSVYTVKSTDSFDNVGSIFLNDIHNWSLSSHSEGLPKCPLLTFCAATLSVLQRHVPNWLQSTRIYRWPQDTQDLLLRLLREERYIIPQRAADLTLTVRPLWGKVKRTDTGELICLKKMVCFAVCSVDL